MTENAKPDTEESPYVEARSTINLQGLPCGATAAVDPNDPYIGMLFERGYLVRV